MESKAVSGLMVTLLLVIMLTLTSSIRPVKAEEKPKPQGMGPSTIAITEDGEYAYVGFHLSETIFKVRLEDLTVDAAADLSAFFPIQCYHIVLDVSGEKLFVHSLSWQKLLVLDTRTMSVVHTIDDIGAVGITRSRYGPFLIIWNGGDTVKFVNTETYDVTEFTDDSIAFEQIQESEAEQGLWYVVTGGPEGWIVGLYDHEARAWNNSFSVHPQDEGSIIDLKVSPEQRKAYVVVWGGFYLDEPHHGYGWLYSIDLVEGEVKVIPIDGGLWCLEVSPDGRWVYVGANWPKPRNVNNILVVDTLSDTVVESIDLSNLPRPNFTEVRDLQIDPVNPRYLYAVSNDANAFIKVDLESLTLVDSLIFNEESFRPHFFVKRPDEAIGYILIHQSANAFELDLERATIEKFVEFPMIRDDVMSYDVAMDDTGRLLIAQGETVLEVDVEDMRLIGSHPLPADVCGLWNFVLSRDQAKLYSIWQDPFGEGGYPNTFLAIDAENFQVEARFRLEGGVFNWRPYEMPDGSKLYALGGWDWGSITIHVIETDGYTIQKTITYDPPGPLGISAGPVYPFAYDSSSHTLFMGAGTVVMGIDTDTDVIKQVIDLADSGRAIGLEPWQFVYVNAIGLVYQPQENYLYIVHLDRAYVSIYDLNNNQFLPKAIPLKGFFPSFAFANDDHSRIYCLNSRSDSVSVIDVSSKAVEKVIDLHAYTRDTIPPIADAGLDLTVEEDTIIVFDGSGSSDNVGIVAYTWTFTDVTQQTLTGAKPTYAFKTPGVYTATLDVTDAEGNRATDTVSITVLDVTDPVARACVIPGRVKSIKAKLGSTVLLDAGGSTDNVGIIGYEWDLGDGTTWTGVTALHTYMELGTITVTLTVEDAAGNTSTDTVAITVEEVAEPVEKERGFPTWMLLGIGAVVVIGLIIGMIPFLMGTRRST